MQVEVLIICIAMFGRVVFARSSESDDKSVSSDSDHRSSCSKSSSESGESVCGTNQVPTDCLPSPACYPQNCSTYGSVCSPPFVCQPGCVCADGYVTDFDTNECVSYKETCFPHECGENAEWNECRSYCPLTCTKQRPDVCILACREPGCQCSDGFVETGTGECVRPEDCKD